MQIIRVIRQTSAFKENVVCIIDDNPNKWHREIEGVQVVGGRDKIIDTVKDYEINLFELAWLTDE